MSYSVFSEVLFLIVFCFAFVWIKAKFKSANAQKAHKVMWALLLVAYAAILLWSALLSRTESDSRSLNLTLFSSYEFMLRVYNSFDIFKQIVDNILVFIPLGVLLPAAYNAKYETKNYVFVVFSGLVMSLIIEVLQYVFSIGFSEIDDVINNVWGCAIGCGIYAFTSKVEFKKDCVILKKGWLKCLMPLVIFIIAFGLIWYFREFILYNM